MAEHNWHQVAKQTWDILVACAKRPTELYYAQLAERLGLHHRLMTHLLELIQSYCREHQLPPLSILVVDKASNQPGSGFHAAPPELRKQVRKEVFAFPWEEIPNPFAFADSGRSETEVVKDILEAPSTAAEVYRLVRERGPMQALFRRALIEAYKGCCAFSGSRLPVLLEAAHIIPWSEATDAERGDVRNGLLLNTYYHRLFDKRLLMLRENYEVAAASELRLDELSEFDRFAIKRVDGKRINLPKLAKHFPSKELLRRRNTGARPSFL